MSRKPRGDAKLKTLPDALQEQLWQLARRTTTEKVLVWLVEKHGVKSSAAALSEFFSWYPRSCTLRQAASFADQLQATIKKLPELKMTAEQASQVAEVSFELQAAQDKDPELFLAIQKGKHNRQKLKNEDRRIAILEKKADQADKAKVIAGNNQLTDEQKAAEIRALFGMG